MRALTTAFRSLPLHQQLAATACLCCLISSLALVALAAQSSSHSQASLQSEYGKAVAEQLARRLGVEMATGDRLGNAGELNKLTEQQSIVAARALEIDGVLYTNPPELNGSQIKYVEVLSGISATNKYGSEGGAGVIVVMTNVSDEKFNSRKNIWNRSKKITSKKPKKKKSKKRKKKS